jgi:hypothetical protein
MFISQKQRDGEKGITIYKIRIDPPSTVAARGRGLKFECKNFLATASANRLRPNRLLAP